MRIAAGIIMIIIGATLLGNNVFLLWVYYVGRIYPLEVFTFAWVIFASIGGIMCIMRRYWGVCLASAIAAVVLGIFGFRLVFAGVWGMLGIILLIFGFPLAVVGGVVSTVFISLRKKEWQEIVA